MKKAQKQAIFWLPRVLCILFILFVSIFALDVFSEGYGFWKTILALLIHLIPSMILVVFLLIAWRWEWTGTVVFDALAVWYAIWSWGKFPGVNLLIMAGPLIVIGFLFMLSWVFKVERRSGGKPAEENPRKPLLLAAAIGTALLFAAGVYAWMANSTDNLTPKRTSIMQPKDGEQVRRQIPVMGGFAPADSSKILWLVVQPFDSTLYHPQPGPLMKPPMRMRWYSTAFFGEPDDAPGGKYHLYLFSATEEATRAFVNYSTEAMKINRWPGMSALPAGLTPLDTVTVIRK